MLIFFSDFVFIFDALVRKKVPFFWRQREYNGSLIKKSSVVIDGFISVSSLI